MQIIVVTDLDGTLLDSRTYSFEPARPALARLAAQGIPLILCSSKTRKEIEYYRQKLGTQAPFISENGGGIFIPRGYFAVLPRSLAVETTENGQYQLIKLGADYATLCSALAGLRAEGFKVKGFGDMTSQEIAGLTGLDPEEAEMARQRDFDEPFVFEGSAAGLAALVKAITARGLRHTQGHFQHIMGPSDKGRALAILKDLFRLNFGEVITVAVGDSLNDLPMLAAADYPIAVRKPDGSLDSRLALPNLIKAGGIGPEGWNQAVSELVERLSKSCCQEKTMKRMTSISAWVPAEGYCLRK